MVLSFVMLLIFYFPIMSWEVFLVAIYKCLENMNYDWLITYMGMVG